MRFIHLAATLSCLLISIQQTQAASIVDNKHDETIAYLQTYGYLPADAKKSEKISDKMFRQALKKLQVSEKRCLLVKIRENFHKKGMKLMTAFALFTIYHIFGKNMIHFLLDKLVNRNYRVTCKKCDSCKHKKYFGIHLNLSQPHSANQITFQFV